MQFGPLASVQQADESSSDDGNGKSLPENVQLFSPDRNGNSAPESTELSEKPSTCKSRHTMLQRLTNESATTTNEQNILLKGPNSNDDGSKLRQMHDRPTGCTLSTITMSTVSGWTHRDSILDSSFLNDAFEEARQIVGELLEGSLPESISACINTDHWKTLSLSSNQSLVELPRFSIDELSLGKRLGKGSFSSVDEIRGITLRKPRSRNIKTTADTPNDISSSPASLFPAALKKIPLPTRGIQRNDTIACNNQESRAFMASHCFRHSGDARYAIKMVRRDVFSSDNEHNIAAAVSDLAVETIFLSSLDHPHIIKLRGIGDVGHPFRSAYFLVLDRLIETLQRRIDHKWKIKEKQLYSFWGRIRDRRRKKRLDFLELRLECAFDLGSAIEYLHGNKIIHRDTKPENIGFDVRGNIKLFDFGMARKLTPNLQVDDENYRLSLCGSPRYMAPEVWANRPYNASCDVYSFGIVLYEMIELRRAFHFCTASSSEEFAVQIFHDVRRPNIDKLRAPAAIKELLPFCWDANPEYRYQMSRVNMTLRQALFLLRRGDELQLPDLTRRRSTFIFEQGAMKGLNNSSSRSFAESVQFISSAP